MLNFGERVKSLRLEKHLTQNKLAERLCVTKATISAYESNIRFPSLDMLVKLSYLFHVSTDYLLGIDKRKILDISQLSKNQINIIKNIIEEFNNN